MPQTNTAAVAFAGIARVLGFADLGLRAGWRDLAVTVATLPDAGTLILLGAGGAETPVAAGQAIASDAIAAGRLVYRPAATAAAGDTSGMTFEVAGPDAAPGTGTHALTFAIHASVVDTVARKPAGSTGLTVAADAALVTSGSAVTWSAAMTGAVIDNSGTIRATAADARAINATGTLATEHSVTLLNHAGALIQSANDAFRVNRDMAAGTLLVDNAGTIASTAGGQALDFDAIASAPAGAVVITNRATGILRAAAADAVRPGQNALVDNAGLIWSDGAIGDKNDGVDFQARAGTVRNRDGGLISGQRHGITSDSHVDVVNEAGGVIVGRNGSGVGSDGTGKVVNYGTIIGAYVGTGNGDGDGVDIDGYGEVDNYGTIAARGSGGTGSDGGINLSDGVALTAGGYVHNHAGAVIESTTFGIAAFGGVAITNEGRIANTVFGDGIVLVNAATGVIDAPTQAAFYSPYSFGNQVTNAGTITALAGFVFGAGPDTLTNTGSIVAATDAIAFGEGDDRLVIGAGSLIAGTVTGGEGDDTIELRDGAVFAAATGFEILSVAGHATLTGDNAFATATLAADAELTIAAGARVAIGTADADVAGADMVVAGTLALGAGSLGARLAGAGTVETADAGTLTLTQANAFEGVLKLLGGTLALADGATLGTGTIDLGDGAGTVTVARTATVAGPIRDLGHDDAIVFRGLVATGATLTAADGHLRIVDGAGTVVEIDVDGVETGLSPVLRAVDGGIALTAATVRIAQDFDGDGRADLLVRDADHDTLRFVAAGSAGSAPIPAPFARSAVPVAEQDPGSSWSAVASLDFDGDGRSDILWRDVDGAFSIWAGQADGSFRKDAYVNATVSGGWRIAATGDFDGDGKDDLLWRHAGGVLTEWQSTGSDFTANVLVTRSMSADWTVVGTGDVNGDGRSDIVWRNGFTGAVSIWQGGSAGFVRNAYTDASVGVAWQLAGIADFDGDGKDDLLWRLGNGDVAVWRSTGNGFAANVFNAHGPAGDWRIGGTDDYNRDGLADLLFRNAVTGDMTVWQSTGSGFDRDALTWSGIGQDAAVLAGATTPTSGRAAYARQDFNKDGWGDLLWRNDDGTLTTWGLFGATAQKNTYYTRAADPSWTGVGTLDANGDGSSDLILRKADGTFSIWLHEGTGFRQDAYLDGSVSADWTLAAIGDLDGDGKDDLLWRNEAAGVLTQWRSTGTGFVANVTYDMAIPDRAALLGTGDIDGDGRDELIWRDRDTGTVSAWKAASGGLVRDVHSWEAALDRTLVGIDDVDGDGRDDLVWQGADGAVQVWRSTGAGFDAASAWAGDPGSGWKVAQVTDFNRDGRADLLLRNVDTGAFVTWQANDRGFDHDVYEDASVAPGWHLVDGGFGL